MKFIDVSQDKILLRLFYRCGIIFPVKTLLMPNSDYEDRFFDDIEGKVRCSLDSDGDFGNIEGGGNSDNAR